MTREASLRILLGKALIIRAVDPMESKARCQLMHHDAAFFGSYIGEGTTGAGTTAKPSESGYLRSILCAHNRIVNRGKSGTDEEAFFDDGEASLREHQTTVATGSVHVSPTEAFMQLSSDSTVSQSFEEEAVTHLALNLIKITEGESHLAGYSAFCVAATCTFAAETALDAHIELIEIQTPQVIYSAYDKLQASMSTSLRAIWAVLDAKGDPNTFPGKPVANEESSLNDPVWSWRSRKLDEMVARGASGLRAVASAIELSEMVPDLGVPLQRFGRYYATDERSEMFFDFEERSCEEEPCEQEVSRKWSYEEEFCDGVPDEEWSDDEESCNEESCESESSEHESCDGEESQDERENTLAFSDFQYAFVYSGCAAS